MNRPRVSDLAAGVYESRWQDAPPKERGHLTTIAQITTDGHEVTTTAIALVLGETATEISYLRDRLSQKGTIFTENGTLRFAVPGMADWILRSD